MKDGAFSSIDDDAHDDCMDKEDQSKEMNPLDEHDNTAITETKSPSPEPMDIDSSPATSPQMETTPGTSSEPLDRILLFSSENTDKTNCDVQAIGGGDSEPYGGARPKSGKPWANINWLHSSHGQELAVSYDANTSKDDMSSVHDQSGEKECPLQEQPLDGLSMREDKESSEGMKTATMHHKSKVESTCTSEDETGKRHLEGTDEVGQSAKCQKITSDEEYDKFINASSVIGDDNISIQWREGCYSDSSTDHDTNLKKSLPNTQVVRNTFQGLDDSHQSGSASELSETPLKNVNENNPNSSFENIDLQNIQLIHVNRKNNIIQNSDTSESTGLHLTQPNTLLECGSVSDSPKPIDNTNRTASKSNPTTSSSDEKVVPFKLQGSRFKETASSTTSDADQHTKPPQPKRNQRRGLNLRSSRDEDYLGGDTIKENLYKEMSSSSDYNLENTEGPYQPVADTDHLSSLNLKSDDSKEEANYAQNAGSSSDAFAALPYDVNDDNSVLTLENHEMHEMIVTLNADEVSQARESKGM